MLPVGSSEPGISGWIPENILSNLIPDRDGATGARRLVGARPVGHGRGRGSPFKELKIGSQGARHPRAASRNPSYSSASPGPFWTIRTPPGGPAAGRSGRMRSILRGERGSPSQFPERSLRSIRTSHPGPVPWQALWLPPVRFLEKQEYIAAEIREKSASPGPEKSPAFYA